MIREEKNALLLLVAFTLGAGLLYVLILKPALEEAARSARAGPQAAADGEEQAPARPADTRPKAVRRMVSVTGSIRDAVTGRPLPAASARILGVEDLVEPAVVVAPDGQLTVELLPPAISFGLEVACRGYRSRTYTGLRDRARSIVDLGLILLDPVRSLSGTVRDARGKPVPEAAVTLFRRAPGPLPAADAVRAAALAGLLLSAPAAAARTGADGRFDFDSLDPAAHVLHVTVRSASGVLEEEIDLESASQRIDVELLEAPLVRGKVAWADEGGPREGHLVAIQAGSGPRGRRSAAIARIDAGGTFAYPALPPRPHHLFVAAPATGRLGVGPLVLPLAGEWTVTAVRGRAIAGRVLDPDQAPAAGLRIRIGDALGRAVPFFVTTDAQGRFAGGGLSGAMVRLEIFDSQRLDLLLATSVPMDHGGDLAIDLATQVSVRGELRAGGVPLAGALVQALEVGRRTLTDAAGRYTLAGLPVGTWTLAAQAPGHVPARSAIELRMRGDNAASFELERGGEVLVFVRGADGLPVEGALVEAWAAPPSQAAQSAPVAGAPPLERLATAAADVRGAARLERLPAAVGPAGDRDLLLVAGAPGHAPARSQPLRVLPEHGAEGVLLTLRKEAGLNGTVTDGGRHPLNAARVRALPVEPEPAAPAILSLAAAERWTGPDGRFELLGLPAGQYRLLVERPGYAARFGEPIPIREGTLLDTGGFVIAEAEDLGGVIRGPDRAPLSQARVALEPEPVDARPAGWQPPPQRTDGAGRFLFPRPPVASYRIVVEAEGLPPFTLAVDPGHPAPPEIVLSPP